MIAARPFRGLFARRFAAALVRTAATTAAGVVLCAVMVRFSPGFGVDERQLDSRLSAASQEALRRAPDAGRNPLLYCVAWAKRAAAGDFGMSQSLNRPVRELLAERAPVTLSLMLWGIAGAWCLAALLSVPPAAARLPKLGMVSNLLAGLPAALPAAGIALLLFHLGASGKWMLALVLFPRVFQYLRNLLMQQYGMPHVLLARAKGIGPAHILWRHVLIPAGGQFVALAAVSVNMAFGAAVAVEAIGDFPGIGQLAWKAALSRDLPVLVAITVMIALATQAANLVAESAVPARRGTV
jgi:peptide/nickel transport system permease protein